MDLTDLAELKATQLAKQIYVVIAEFRDGSKRLCQDPGLDTPWGSRNRKLAIDMADQVQKDRNVVKAAAVTLEEAFTILQRQFAQHVKRN